MKYSELVSEVIKVTIFTLTSVFKLSHVLWKCCIEKKIFQLLIIFCFSYVSLVWYFFGLLFVSYASIKYQEPKIQHSFHTKTSQVPVTKILSITDEEAQKPL